MLVEALLERQHDYHVPISKRVYYALERAVAHKLLRRPPPAMPGENLLNLGCGPHVFPGWVNADDYALKRYFLDRRFRPNWRLDISKPWLCPDNHWDGIFTESVIEYFVYSEAIGVFRECLRTLKPGARIRIAAPDALIYTAYYRGEIARDPFPPFPHPLLGIGYLTQKPFHVSTWDADLLVRMLSEIGFAEAAAKPFGEGADGRLLKDDPEKRHESLYVEARKPL